MIPRIELLVPADLSDFYKKCLVDGTIFEINSGQAKQI